MHDPEYGHEHAHHTEHSREEALALLKYMADHTRHHVDELHDLGHSVGGDAEEKIHEACGFFRQGIEKLDEALRLLKGE